LKGPAQNNAWNVDYRSVKAEMISRIFLKIAICLITLGLVTTWGARPSNPESGRIRGILDGVVYRLEDFERRSIHPEEKVFKGSSILREAFFCQAEGIHFANRQALAQLVPDLSRRKSLTEGEEKLVSRLVSGYLKFGQIIKRILAFKGGRQREINVLSLHLARLSQYQKAGPHTPVELLKVFRKYFGSLESVLSNTGAAEAQSGKKCGDPT